MVQTKMRAAAHTLAYGSHVKCDVDNDLGPNDGSGMGVLRRSLWSLSLCGRTCSKSSIFKSSNNEVKPSAKQLNWTSVSLPRSSFPISITVGDVGLEAKHQRGSGCLCSRSWACSISNSPDLASWEVGDRVSASRLRVRGVGLKWRLAVVGERCGHQTSPKCVAAIFTLYVPSRSPKLHASGARTTT